MITSLTPVICRSFENKQIASDLGINYAYSRSDVDRWLANRGVVQRSGTLSSAQHDAGFCARIRPESFRRYFLSCSFDYTGSVPKRIKLSCSGAPDTALRYANL